MTDVETGNYIPWDEGVANYGYVKYLDHIKLLNEECAQRMSLGSALIRIATELASSQDKSLLAVLEEHGVKLEVE
jgi:hypothetical protein